MPLRPTLALACALLLAAPAFAQAPRSASEVTLANFGYAMQLGSGLYTLDGQQMLILRVPVSFDFRPETEQHWGLRGRFEIMGGFYNFQPEHVLESGLPERIDSIAIVPGIEFRHRASRGWLVVPFAGIGGSWNAQHAFDSWILHAGVRAAKNVPLGSWTGSWANELSWLHISPRGESAAGSSIWIESCFEARHRLGVTLGQSDADYAPYVLLNVYSSQFQLLLSSDNVEQATATIEAGVTFGLRPLKRFLGAEPRLGFGYRLGSRVAVARIVLGVPARSLDP